MDDAAPFFNFIQRQDCYVDRACGAALCLMNPLNYTMVENDLTMIFRGHPQYFEGFIGVRFYGSRMFGLAEVDSDLDVFVEMGESLVLWSFDYNSSEYKNHDICF